MDPIAEKGVASVTRRDDATLVIRLSGRWQLATGLPSSEAVRRQISGTRPRAVAFETQELRGWDSAVVTFLAGVSEVCRESDVTMERDGLPAGIRRLLSLAEAVPEKAG